MSSMRASGETRRPLTRVLAQERESGQGVPPAAAKHLAVRFVAAVLPLFVAACGGPADTAIPDGSSLTGISGEARQLAVEHFNRGDYGLAERYYREAAEKTPKDAAVWIGLAASYDRLRRFDLADRAYEQAIKLSGETAQILNNQGYSYLLRGNLGTAKAKLSKALALDPDNPTLLNNLKLLEASARYKAS